MEANKTAAPTIVVIVADRCTKARRGVAAAADAVRGCSSEVRVESMS
jgi:hypothetical protein